MLREEAEREAERCNLEDPDRDRFEFYAFDESAGMAADAWDVAARLRQGPRTDRPATAAAAAAALPSVMEETVAHETVPAYEEPAYAPVEYAPVPEEVLAPEEYAAPVPEDAFAEEPPDEDRPGLVVRVVGSLVVVAGLLWIAMVVALAVFLGPEDATSVAVYVAAGALGVLAIALGIAIRRS